MTNDTRIIDLTVEEMIDLVHEAMKKPVKKKEFLRGPGELAIRYGVCNRTAMRWIHDPRFSEAVYRNGRVITIEAETFDNIFKSLPWKKQA